MKRHAPKQMFPREPNGRISRRRIHIMDRQEMTQREAQSVAIEARMRLFGLTAEQAKQQEGGTVIGRMRQARELSADQAEAASTYLSARNAYHRAIGAVSDTGRIPLPEAEGCGTYEEFCQMARTRWDAITEVLQSVMIEIRSPAPVSALDHFAVRDVYVAELVGDLRVALNALHRHFSATTRLRRKAA